MEYTEEDIAELADLFTNGPDTEADDCVAMKVVRSSRVTTNLCSVKTERSTDEERQASGISHTTLSTAVPQPMQTVEQADRNVFSPNWEQPQNSAASIQRESGSYPHKNLPLPTTSLGGQRQRQSEPTLNKHALAQLKKASGAAINSQQMTQDPRLQNTGLQQWPVVFQWKSQERQPNATRDSLSTVGEQQNRLSVSNQHRQYRNMLPKVVARHQLPVAALGELQQRMQTSGHPQPATTVANQIYMHRGNHTHQQQCMQTRGQSQPAVTLASQVNMHRGNHTHQQRHPLHVQQQTPAAQWNFINQGYTQQERHVNVNDLVHHRPITSELGQQRHHGLQAKKLNQHQVVPNQWCPPPLPRPVPNVATPMSQQQQRHQQQIYQQQQHHHRHTTTYNGIHQPISAQCHPPQTFTTPGMAELQQRLVNVHESSHRPVARQSNQQRWSTSVTMHQPDTTQWSKGPFASHGDVWLTRPTIFQRSQPITSIAKLVNVPHQRPVSEQHQERLLATNESGKQHKATVSQPGPPQSKPLCMKQSQPQGTHTPPYPNEYQQPLFALEDLGRYEPIYSGEAVVEEVTFTREEAIALFDKPACKPLLGEEVYEKKLPIPNPERTDGTNRCESPMDCSIPTLKDKVDDLKVEGCVKIEQARTGLFNKRFNTYENPYDLTLKDLDIYQESYEKDAFLTTELCSMENGRSETKSPVEVNGPQGDVPLIAVPNVSTAMDTSHEHQHQYVNIQHVSCDSTMKSEISNNTRSPTKGEDEDPVNHHKTRACSSHEPTAISQEPQQENQCSFIGKANLTNYKHGPTTHREKRILDLWTQKLGYVLPTRKQVVEMSVCLQRRKQFLLLWLSNQLWAKTQCQERKAARRSQKHQHRPTHQQQAEHGTFHPQANLIPTIVNRLQSRSICYDNVIPTNESDSHSNFVSTKQSSEPIHLQCEGHTSSCESDSISSIETEHEKSTPIQLISLASEVSSKDTNCGSGIESDSLPSEEMTLSDQNSIGKELCLSDCRSYNPGNLALQVLGEISKENLQLVNVAAKASENSKENHESENVTAKSLPTPKHMKKLTAKQKQTEGEKMLRKWMSDHPGNIRPNKEEVEELSTITDTSSLFVRKFFARERMTSNKKLWLQKLSADPN